MDTNQSYHNTGDKMETKKWFDYANNNVCEPNDDYAEHIEMVQILERIEYHFDNETRATRFFIGIKSALFECDLLDDYTIKLHTRLHISVWVWTNKSIETPPYV